MDTTKKPWGANPRANDRRANFSRASIHARPVSCKPSLSDLLPLGSGTKERHGACPFCGGTDRFMVFVDSGRGWCRQCHWSGDSLQYVIDAYGLSFREAQRKLGLDTITSPSVTRQQSIHRYALATAKHAYAAWQRRLFRALIAEYEELHREADIAEVAYRAIHREPTRYTDEERRYWTHKLGKIYDRLYVVEDALDILTFSCNERARLAWWRASEEVSRGD